MGRRRTCGEYTKDAGMVRGQTHVSNEDAGDFSIIHTTTTAAGASIHTVPSSSAEVTATACRKTPA